MPELVGTELVHLLHTYEWLEKFRKPNPDKPSCKCRDRAELMDKWGADKCERRSDQIVGWLVEGAAAHGLPKWKWAARRYLRLAIKRARKHAAIAA